MIEPAYPNRCPSTVSWHAAGTVPASSCSPCPDFVARISRIHRDGTQRLSARYMHHQAGSTAYCTYMYSNSIDPLARRQNRPACLAPHCTPLRTSTDNSAGPSRHREMTCTCRGTRSTHAGFPYLDGRNAAGLVDANVSRPDGQRSATASSCTRTAPGTPHPLRRRHLPPAHRLVSPPTHLPPSIQLLQYN
jgi:hypothetical protein